MRSSYDHWILGITLDNIEIEKRKFQSSEYPININDADIYKIILFEKLSLSKKDFKYFIGYNGDEEVKSWFIILPIISSYTKSFDESKYMFFLIKDMNSYKNIMISQIKLAIWY